MVVDNNVGTSAGTNEDEIYVIADREVTSGQDPSAPVSSARIRRSPPASGLLVVYGFRAYSARRYTNGHQKVGGS